LNYVKVRKTDMLVVTLSTTAQSPDVNEFLEVSSEFIFNQNNDYRYNQSDSTFYDVGTKSEVVNPSAQVISPFGSKTIIVDGVERKLFQRISGKQQSAIMNVDTTIDYVIPYDVCKITGIEIIGCKHLDVVDLMVLDTPTNTISGLDVPTYGANYQLDQFGYDVNVSNDRFNHQSKYDADLIKDMVVRIIYKEKNAMTKTVSINYDLHEVI